MALSIVKTILVIKDVRYLVVNMSMTVWLIHVQQIGDNTDSPSKNLSNTEAILSDMMDIIQSNVSGDVKIEIETIQGACLWIDFGTSLSPTRIAKSTNRIE